ncbi:MAG: hypothetical protein ACE5IG_06885 [Dehalococcoidia bacterium]
MMLALVPRLSDPMKRLGSEHTGVSGLRQLLELAWDQGWTDGHPVIPPLEEWVQEFLDYAALEPDQVIGTIPERDRAINAEKLAINAVMAGSKPEYMPVLVAAVEAICDPDFKFNHLASLGSPWPLLIVNGPVVRELEINTGMYLFGAGGWRANATIGRAISLLLWNCAEARPDGIQRGQWGNPIRFSNVIGENEELDWEPLHVQMGFPREQSVVTAVSTYPSTPNVVWCSSFVPEWIAQVLAYHMGHNPFFRQGTYVLFVPPLHAEAFIQGGWSKEDLRRHIMENAGQTVAELKRCGRWARNSPGFTGYQGNPAQVEPGDEEWFVYLFKEQTEFADQTFSPSEMAHRIDIFVMVAGGDAGFQLAYTLPYGESWNPVTKPIRLPA